MIFFEGISKIGRHLIIYIHHVFYPIIFDDYDLFLENFDNPFLLLWTYGYMVWIFSNYIQYSRNLLSINKMWYLLLITLESQIIHYSRTAYFLHSIVFERNFVPFSIVLELQFIARKWLTSLFNRGCPHYNYLVSPWVFSRSSAWQASRVNR